MATLDLAKQSSLRPPRVLRRPAVSQELVDAARWALLGELIIRADLSVKDGRVVDSPMTQWTAVLATGSVNAVDRQSTVIASEPGKISGPMPIDHFKPPRLGRQVAP